MDINMILVFDVETTGFPSLDKPKHLPTQGRIIQMAASLFSSEFEEVAGFHSLIAIPREHDIIMRDEAFECHGISLDHARRYGCLMEQALMNLQLLACSSAVQVAHNIAFDLRAIGVEEKFHQNIPEFVCPNRFDTMFAMTEICKLQKSNGARKSPSLEEAFAHCTGVNVEKELHRATTDIHRILTVYQWLVKNNHTVLPPNIIDIPPESFEEKIDSHL